MEFKKISHIKELDGMVNAVGMFIKCEKCLLGYHALYLYDKKGRRITVYEEKSEGFYDFSFLTENCKEAIGKKRYDRHLGYLQDLGFNFILKD